MATYTEDFAGAAADLTTPWVQWDTVISHPFRRDGSGLGSPTLTSLDSGAIYNNTVGNDQYSQFVPQFNGPADTTKYIYLLLRAPNTANSYLAGSFYWFWSDGGSDTQILKTTNGAALATNIKTDNTFTYASGDTIKFEVVGTTLKVYKNGTVFSGLTVTDATIASGFPGMGAEGSVLPTVDNWQGGDVSAGTIPFVGARRGTMAVTSGGRR